MNKKSTKVVMSLAVLALTVIVANAQYRNTQVPFNYKTFRDAFVSYRIDSSLPSSWAAAIDRAANKWTTLNFVAIRLHVDSQQL
jgi:hypothetical protein